MFRFVFLILPKIVMPSLLSLMLAEWYINHKGGFAEFFFPVLFAAFAAGMSLFLYLQFVRKTLACPLCDCQGPLKVNGEEIGINCQNCGYVYLRSPFALKFRVRPHEPTDDQQ